MKLGRKHFVIALCAAVVGVGMGATLSQAAVSLTKNSSTNWTIDNGALTVVFSPSGEKLTSLKVDGSSGTNLISSLDQEFAGTPFGAGTETFNSQVGPNNSYVDVWTTVASTGTSTNPITYAFHYVLFANDPTVHVYEVVNHSASDPATSIGQGQFLFRSNPSLFPQLYQVDTGPNNLAATLKTVPSTASNFGTISAQAGRTVQDATTDLTGSGLAGDNGSNFYEKYDYSVYDQFYQSETMLGSQYAVSSVISSMETMTGGPTKQMLAQTNPGILNLEFMSGHYGVTSTGAAYPGTSYVPPQGVDSSRLFGAYAFRVTTTNGESAAQINQDALNAIPTYDALYNTDSELIASGYTPSTARGSLQLTATSTAGWSSNTTNNTVVLSDNQVNMQETHQGDQYWTQIGANGAATISGVVPGTYRMTLYQLGQWGETRVDNVQVKSGQITIPQNVKFTPENFGTAAPIFTIGTPNRSGNEFLNGHDATGADIREFYGAYDQWAQEAAMGTPGKVVYYATAVGSTPATNDPNKWMMNQWKTFNPGLYDATNGTSDNYQNTAPSYVRDAAHGGTGPGPASYSGSPWEVHFTTSAAQRAQGQFVVLSVGLAAANASLVVTLNGFTETWHETGTSGPMYRSGVAGFYQFIAFQFPVSDLLTSADADNIFTFGVSQADGVTYDAMRMEITNTSAAPSTTGWFDYSYVNSNGSSNAANPNDALGLSAQQTFAVPEPTNLGVIGGAMLMIGMVRRSRRGVGVAK